MTLHAPQIILVALAFLGLGISLSDHGKPQRGEENFFTTLIAQGIIFALLYWGGFFG